jgi:hypothetical protein
MIEVTYPWNMEGTNLTGFHERAVSNETLVLYDEVQIAPFKPPE